MLRGALFEAQYFLRLCKLEAINVTGKEKWLPAHWSRIRNYKGQVSICVDDACDLKVVRVEWQSFGLRRKFKSIYFHQDPPVVHLALSGKLDGH